MVVIVRAHMALLGRGVMVVVLTEHVMSLRGRPHYSVQGGDPAPL